jgi:hypothetical protein
MGGLGLVFTANSGGLTGNPILLNALSATAAQIGFSAGLVSLTGGFAYSRKNTIVQVSLGSFVNGPAAALAIPADQLLTAFQSTCH